MSESQPFTNRLIKEKSPYLLQHAHNPVDWYPWGPEAFAAARDQDKPILLSIGYATCHWCHVMERECFEDPSVAKLMNESFINIKVDREELPEVDNLYMEFALSMMAGAAGWPLNVILTPNLQPFFAATYLPPKASHGLTGFVDLIQRVNDVWRGEEKEHVIEQAENIVEAFAMSTQVSGEQINEIEAVQDTAELLFKMADPVYGGIKGVPKFPIGYQWNLLLHYASYAEDGRSLFLVERTLDMMQRGGIYDHLGGGFSRYSTDEKWMVPHFEKMLYDNAILAYSYLEAWQITQNKFYRNTCTEILNYILRDMTHPEGVFYSAEDSDSEGHEGLFYTWKLDEVRNILGEKESGLFCEYYGISAMGNFEGRNILHIPVRLEEFAEKKSIPAAELETLFAMQREVLWKVRERRVHPFKDDKILTSWNGLMIFALAEAGAALDDKNYLNAAVRAAEFIRKHLWRPGQLLRRWRDGEALYDANIEDYAFMIKGLLSLFETGQGVEWLEWAVEMTDILKKSFKAEEGAFYQTDGQDPNILLRKCQFSDGAEPSGNAIHCENLLRLYQLSSDRNYLEQAEDILTAVEHYINNYSPGYCYHLLNLIRYYDKHAITAVVSLNEEEEHKEDILKLFYHRFMPHRTIVWRHYDDTGLAKIIPFAAMQVPIKGKTTLYMCTTGGVCQKPITEFSEMITAVQEK